VRVEEKQLNCKEKIVERRERIEKKNKKRMEKSIPTTNINYKNRKTKTC